MPFNNTIINSENLVAPEWFVNAKAVISTGKGWKKWQKTVSRSVYERILDDIRNFGEKTGVEERLINRFIIKTLDYYIDNGSLQPCKCQYNWELGLFALFKRRIDEAIRRRVRAIEAAARRRERIDALKESQAQTPEDEGGQAEITVNHDADTASCFVGSPAEMPPVIIAGCRDDNYPFRSKFSPSPSEGLYTGDHHSDIAYPFDQPLPFQR